MFNKVEIPPKNVFPPLAESLGPLQLLQQLYLAPVPLLAGDVAMKIDNIEESVALPKSKMF